MTRDDAYRVAARARELADWPIAQLRSPSGLVMTLYRGVDHPFIHALSTADAWAVCIDLPVYYYPVRYSAGRQKEPAAFIRIKLPSAK